jgi:hypothetical protein
MAEPTTLNLGCERPFYVFNKLGTKLSSWRPCTDSRMAAASWTPTPAHSCRSFMTTVRPVSPSPSRTQWSHAPETAFKGSPHRLVHRFLTSADTSVRKASAACSTEIQRYIRMQGISPFQPAKLSVRCSYRRLRMQGPPSQRPGRRTHQRSDHLAERSAIVVAGRDHPRDHGSVRALCQSRTRTPARRRARRRQILCRCPSCAEVAGVVAAQGGEHGREAIIARSIMARGTGPEGRGACCPALRYLPGRDSHRWPNTASRANQGRTRGEPGANQPTDCFPLAWGPAVGRSRGHSPAGQARPGSDRPVSASTGESPTAPRSGSVDGRRRSRRPPL